GSAATGTGTARPSRSGTAPSRNGQPRRHGDKRSAAPFATVAPHGTVVEQARGTGGRQETTIDRGGVARAHRGDARPHPRGERRRQARRRFLRARGRGNTGYSLRRGDAG